MKKYYLTVAILLAVACTKNDDEKSEFNSGRQVYTASMEQTDSKVFVNGKLKTLWTEGDLISIFNTTTNKKFSFAGKTGDTEATFVEEDGFYQTGIDVPTTYAVYPYQMGTSVSMSGKLSVSLPSVQEYAYDTYGLGANTMVAATKTLFSKTLHFKSLCGFIVFNLYGEGKVKSICLKGNNQEKIAGECTVSPVHGENPSVVMSEGAGTTVTLDCGSGIEIGATKDVATSFWIVVPPVNFSKGFTVTIKDIYGESIEKTVSSSKKIARNLKNTMDPLEVKFRSKPNNVTFKDANFKAYCVLNFDLDKDDEISFDEAARVTGIDINKQNVATLEGIEFFTGLKSLNCNNNKLSSLDLSNNPSLTNLKCAGNYLTILDVSKNLELTSLYCSPMNGTDEKNLLATLIIHKGQTIIGVTQQRSTVFIPAETVIRLDTTYPGGTEPTGEDGEL